MKPVTKSTFMTEFSQSFPFSQLLPTSPPILSAHSNPFLSDIISSAIDQTAHATDTQSVLDVNSCHPAVYACFTTNMFLFQMNQQHQQCFLPRFTWCGPCFRRAIHWCFHHTEATSHHIMNCMIIRWKWNITFQWVKSGIMTWFQEDIKWHK